MSDHVDGPRSIGDPAADLAGLFAFTNPENPQRTRELFELSQPLVYRHTADMMALGADIRAQAEERRRIGFRSRGVAAE